MKEVTDPVEIAQAIHENGGKCSTLIEKGFTIQCTDCPFYKEPTRGCQIQGYKTKFKIAGEYLRMTLFNLI